MPVADSVEQSAEIPLTLPRELWAELAPQMRRVYRAGQAIVDQLEHTETVEAAHLFESLAHSPRHFEQALLHGAVHLLETMDLVAVSESQGRQMVRLLAKPEDHIRVRGPDGKTRWVFVARPLREPLLDPLRVN